MATEAAPVTVVQNVRIFDGSRVVPVGSVLVEQGLVADVAHGSRIAAPAGALVVEGHGRTLLPGLMDCHTRVTGGMREQALLFGVTTVVDMSADPVADALFRRSGPGSTDSAGPRSLPVLDEWDDVRIVRGRPSAPGWGDGDVVQVIVTTAHARRPLVVAHVMCRDSARRAVASGVDGLAHLFVDGPADERFVAALADAGAFVIPTLTALEGLCGTPSGSELARDRRLARYMDAECRSALTQALPPVAEPPLRLEYALDAVTRLRAAGVPILTGTDAPNPGTAPGVSVHRELEMLVGAGLTPVEALAAATSVPARCLGLTDRGRVARGLHADLLLVDGDPTTDIRATRSILGVWRRGEWVGRQAVDRPVAAATPA